jgi:nucleoid-associated protein YgaU
MADMFGALEKAMLIVVDGQGVPPLLRFSYNPEQYTIEKSAEWSRPKAPGPESTPNPDYTSTNPTKISMEILFDAVDDPLGDVMHDIQILFEWTKPTLLSRFVHNPQPPLLMFQWGVNPALATFRGFLRSVSTRYTLFSTDGRPLRATCTIQLEEVPFEIFKQNPTSGSRPGIRSHTVTEGETLHSVAWAEYRQPRYWRALAAFNGIDDPLRVPAGTTLLLPSSRDAAEIS